MKLTLGQLRNIIKESLALNYKTTSSRLVLEDEEKPKKKKVTLEISHNELSSIIDDVLGPDYTNISALGISGFAEAMKEFALVESGYRSSKESGIGHDDDRSSGAKGYFQLTRTALNDLKSTEHGKRVPKTKQYWRENSPDAKEDPKWDGSNEKEKNIPWNKIDINEILNGSSSLQATAACLYTLFLWLEVAGKPDISQRSGRAEFWSTYYNSVADELGTVAYYNKKLSDIGYE